MKLNDTPKTLTSVTGQRSKIVTGLHRLRIDFSEDPAGFGP